MTYKQRLKAEHPEKDEEAIKEYTTLFCPFGAFGDVEPFDCGPAGNCDQCWEMPVHV